MSAPLLDHPLHDAALQDLEAKRPQIEEICRRYKAAKLSLFGSILRPHEFHAESDIDFLVEFEPDARIGLAFWGMELDLEDLIGRKVQLKTAMDLSRYFREEVIAEAEVFYATP